MAYFRRTITRRKISILWDTGPSKSFISKSCTRMYRDMSFICQWQQNSINRTCYIRPTFGQIRIKTHIYSMLKRKQTTYFRPRFVLQIWDWDNQQIPYYITTIIEVQMPAMHCRNVSYVTNSNLALNASNLLPKTTSQW